MSSTEQTELASAPLKLLRLPAVEEITGLKKSSVYALVQAGSLPAPVRLSARAVAWRSDEISEWVASRAKAAGSSSHG